MLCTIPVARMNPEHLKGSEMLLSILHSPCYSDIWLLKQGLKQHIDRDIWVHGPPMVLFISTDMGLGTAE